jgi:hypothetical protein
MRAYLSLSASRPEIRVLAAISGLWMSRLVGFAVKAGLFEALDEGLGVPAELAAAKQLAAGPLARALEGLAHLGLLERDGERYALTVDGRLLLPKALGGFADMAVLWSELFDGAWAEFESTVRTGSPGFIVRHGEPIFARIRRDPPTAKRFAGAMTGLAQLVAREASASLAERIRALGCARVCDVGGGEGFLVTEVARRCPGVAFVLFDLPEVVQPSAGKLQAAGIAASSGSFFTSVPSADAHVLSNVIHDWSDAEAVHILQNVRRAQGKAGALFLLEMMLGGDAEPLLARSTDLNMLVLTGGRERTRGEFDTLLSESGYRLVSARPIGEYTCLLEAVPMSLP